MTNRAEIDSLYHCIHKDAGQPAGVWNKEGYLLAEYSRASGFTRWIRVIPPDHRARVERWLAQHLPALTSVASPGAGASPAVTVAAAPAGKRR